MTDSLLVKIRGDGSDSMTMIRDANKLFTAIAVNECFPLMLIDNRVAFFHSN